jgi:hypothetical protein
MKAASSIDLHKLLKVHWRETEIADTADTSALVLIRVKTRVIPLKIVPGVSHAS